MLRSHRSAVLCVVLALGLAAPSTEAAAQEAAAGTSPTKAEQLRRFPPSSVRPKLIAGGLGLTAAAYGIGAGAAASWPEVPGSERLYIPVAGPWLALAEGGCPSDNPDCDASLVLRSILLVISGLSQAGGMAVVAEGVFMTTEADAAAPTTAFDWHLSPISLPTATRTPAMGLGVSGTF